MKVTCLNQSSPPGLCGRPLVQHRLALTMGKLCADSDGVGTPVVKPLNLLVRNKSGWNASTIPAHVAPWRRMPFQSLARKPQVSTTALPPKKKPEAELPFCAGLFHEEKRSRHGGLGLKPKEGCVPGLESWASKKSDPSLGLMEAPHKGFESASCCAHNAGPKAEPKH